jgi:methionyl-tRNA synthetase
MSAGIELPRQVYGHGFLLSRGEKMSKSVGNVVDPMVLAERFGVDALRYFLLREVPFGQDGSYSAEAIVARANAELANSFGNLAQRTLSMVHKNLGGVLPAAGEAPEDAELLNLVSKTAKQEVPEAFDRFAFSVGIEAWLRAVFACNQYVDGQAPWTLRKTDPERMAAVLGTLVAAVRELTSAIAPIIPESADKLLTLIDAGEGGTPIPQPTPLFPRLELAEDEEEEAA